MNIEENAKVVIDFEKMKNKSIEESFLKMFGGAIETLLGRMFGSNNIPVTLKGKRGDIEQFLNVLQNEKRYARDYQKYRGDFQSLLKNKKDLDDAISKFENKTGIPYPLK